MWTLDVLSGMRYDGLTLDTIRHEAAISACENASTWVLELLSSVRREGIEQSTVDHKAAIVISLQKVCLLRLGKS